MTWLKPFIDLNKKITTLTDHGGQKYLKTNK